jgi:hypothetical protein
MDLLRYRYFYLFLLVLVGAAQLCADLTGAVSGYVLDSSGSAVAPAPVHITDVGTSTSHDTVTSDTGDRGAT